MGFGRISAGERKTCPAVFYQEKEIFMNFAEEKKEIVHYAKIMYRKGMINMFEGNISVRCGDVILVTPSQQNKETLVPEDILELDREGHVLAENGKRPSSETKMHYEVYRLRPDVKAVVHNHSPYATAYALAGRNIEDVALAESRVLFGDIPVCSYGTPGSAEVYRDFERYLCGERCSALLLSNHGLVTVGPDLETAYSRAEAVEKIAQISILGRLLGGQKDLPAGEKERLDQQRRNQP